MTAVLVYVPTYTGTGHPMAESSALSLQFDGIIDVEIVDGAERFGWPQDKSGNLLEQQQNARQLAIGGDYDWLLFHENDMLVQPDVVTKMVALDADVVYSPYMFRHGRPIISAFRYENDHALGMSLTNYPDELRQAWIDGVVRVSGAGFGCTLISRKVFTAIDFRRDKHTGYADLPFARDCLAAGFTSMALFSSPSLHYDGEKWLSTGGHSEED